jgi:hypothetical protein
VCSINKQAQRLFVDAKRCGATSGFSLIRVYRFQKITQNVPSAEVLLQNLKWPIETMFCGMRPQFNVTNPVYSTTAVNGVSSGNVNAWRDWHRLTRLHDQVCRNNACAGSMLTTQVNPAIATVAAFNGPVTGQIQNSLCQSERLVWAKSTKTLKTVRITAHGINIFQDFNAEFFSDYLPYHYGGYNIVTPEDDGAIMVNFALYPGTYQPSGHINVSRAREFFFAGKSAMCNINNYASELQYNP